MEMFFRCSVKLSTQGVCRAIIYCMKKRSPLHAQDTLPVLPKQPILSRNKKFLTFTIGLFLFLFAMSFGTIAFGPNQFFLRDSGFFYYPLFEQIQHQWESGQLPLWDPYENLGQPLLANPTSSLFYPGKAIFFLSSLGFLSYGVCFKWYILLHFPLAFYWFYRLARHIGLSRAGSTLGATVWTFSGPILFATSNPVFLIGASWLPAGLLFADKTLRTGALRNATVFAAVLALMVLGGDPEAAWLCVVLSFGLAIIVFRRRKATVKIVFAHGGMLLAGIILGTLACAVVVLPGLDMKRSIDRGNPDAPLSVWDLAGSRFCGSPSASLASDSPLVPDATASEQNRPGTLDNILCRRLDHPGHASSIYRFSLPPWRLCELIFPNVGGDWVSGRGRWLAMLPHDDQLWTASLYAGTIPFLLAVWAVFPLFSRSKKKLPKYRTQGYRGWTIWLVFLAMLAAFGAFGPGWLIGVMGHGWDNDIRNGDPVGGLYWFMVVFMPQFATFRYPAKLTVLIVFALALLAGMGLDRLRTERSGAQVAIFAFVPSGILCVLAALFGPVLLESFNGQTFAGSMPLDALAVSRLLSWSFGQTALVAFLFWLTLTRAKTVPAIRKASLMIILVLTAIDLTWAHRYLIPSVPDEAYRSKSLVAQTIQDDLKEPNDPGSNLQPIRVWRGIEWNPFFLTQQKDRLQHAFALDRKTLAPKFSYANHLGIANVHGTGIEHAYRRFIEQLESMSHDESRQDRLLEMLAQCNVRYLVLPWQNRQGEQTVLPHATLLDANTPRQYSMLNQPEQAFEHLDDPWPINTLVWRNNVPGNMLQIKTTGNANAASATLTLYTGSRIEFDVVCPNSCQVIVAEQYWNGWKSQAVSKANPEIVLTLATSRDTTTGFLRQLAIPAGTWHVTMEYHPVAVYWGLAVSLMVWILLIVVWLVFGSFGISTAKIQANTIKRLA